MLLTIFNLPANTRYNDIKSLIQNKCGFKDLILDNLSHIDNNTKKVTVGLAEEEDAAILVRKMNGLFFEGRQLYVETVTKKQENTHSDMYKQHPRQPFEPPTQMQQGMPGRPNNPPNQARNFPQLSLQQPYYQQSSYQQPNYQSAYDQTSSLAFVPPLMPHHGMYGASADQNAFANYGYPQQMPYQSTSQVRPQAFGAFDQGAPLGFNNQGSGSGARSNQNDRKVASNQNSQQSSNIPAWKNSRDAISHPSRDAPIRDHARDSLSRKYGRDDAPRDHGRRASSRDRARDAPARDYGRDVSRDRPRHRQRRPANHGRVDPSGDNRGDAPYRSNEKVQAPPKPTFSSRDAPAKPSIPFSTANTIYGNHVTDPVQRMVKSRKPDPDYIPPAKRQRQGIGFGKPANEPKPNVPVIKKNPTAPTKKKNKAKPKPETIVNRAKTWRCQIASSLAKDIVNNPKFKNDIEPQLFLTELKRGIRHRLETMFGNDYEVCMVDMLRMYRDKYDISSDEDFYKEVTEEIKKNGSYLADQAQTAVPGETENEKEGNKNEKEENKNKKEGNKNEKQENKNKKEENKNKKQPEPARNSQPASRQLAAEVNKTIPSYPQGDKWLNKLNKKKNREIYNDEDTLLCQLQPAMQKELNEHVDEICSLIIDEFSETTEPQHKEIHERIKTEVVPDLKKNLKLNFAKRQLNIGPIMLRIFNSPKIISRGTLAPALAEYGITSIRKSAKSKIGLYIGTCDTYDDHDRLCKMKPFVVGGTTVTIKPFQLAGERKKIVIGKNKAQPVNVAQSYTDTGENGENVEQESEADEDIEENADADDQIVMEGDNNDDEGEEISETANVNDEQEEINKNEGEENTDTDTAHTENANTEAAIIIKTEGNNEESTQENGEVKHENSTDTDKSEDKKGFEEPNETKTVADDTTEVNNAEIKDSKETTKEMSNNSLEIDTEPENIDDVEDRKDAEDIDIDDVHEDDLEDWV